MQKQELSTLSLARRAGKLVLGFDKVVEEMRAGKVKGVFYRDYDDGYDDHDYMRDTWDAMTDGMYGDMPDDFDGDFSFLGY